jgi:hypothetical protein
MTSPRARTLQHMKRLASLAAAGAALSGAACTSSGGYGVVDPLPPPPKCGKIAADVPASVVAKEKVFELTFAKPLRAVISYDTEQKPVPDEATEILDVVHASDGSMVVTVMPTAGALKLQVGIAVNCPEGLQWIEALVDISAAPTVKVVDNAY